MAGAAAQRRDPLLLLYDRYYFDDDAVHLCHFGDEQHMFQTDRPALLQTFHR